MSENTNPDFNYFDECIATVWAILPEEMAATIAGVKKDFLTGLRSTVDSMVDHDLNCLDRHLAAARRKRAEWRQQTATPGAEAAQ
jgi:hypothetical protein